MEPLTYRHAVLLTELPNPQLVHGGGHVLHRLLQVFGVTLHQRVGDAAAAVLQEEKGRETLEMSEII